MKLSKLATSMKPSPTLFLVAKAKELSSQGHDVISLSVGEPDWPTFSAPSKAGLAAIESGFSKYTAAAGIPELRKAIVKQIKQDLNIDYSEAEVTVATGAKFIIFAALQMLCDAGDEVVFQSPYWVSYPVMTEMAGAKPVVVDCHLNSDFKMKAADLKKTLTNKTKVIILCSPSNPTGLFYTRDELNEIAKVLREYPQVTILSDDIYNRLVLDPQQGIAPHILQVAPDLKERTLIINGVSKSYAMTGWRIGWAVGPKPLVQAMADYQSQTTSSACSISQKAACAAIENSEVDVKKSVQMLIERKKSALEKIKTLPLVSAIEPQGAFYLWLDIRKTFGKSYEGEVIKDSKTLCGIFLEKFFVAAVPGVEFGAEGFMRLSFAIETPRMLEALSRFEKLLKALS